VSQLAAPEARRGGAVVTVCPNAVLVWLALVGLFFVSWLGSLAALLFLVAGLSLFFRAPGETAGALVDAWWIMLIPLWCTLSFIWSDHPGLSLRHGIQLGLTVAIGIAIATRVSPHTLLKAVFFAALVAALASLVFGRARLDGGGYIGIYASKNDFAFAMLIFLSASVAIMLSRDVANPLRLLSVACVALGFMLLVMAQSVGWLLAGIGVAATGMLAVLLRAVSIPLRLLAACLSLIAVVALAQYAAMHSEAFLVLLTETTNRDGTLTGRTDLWQTAREEIATAEILGRGYQAYWVRGNEVAEAIWEEFGIASRSGFHFHNTWLSNWVEIGLIGIVLYAVVFGRALIDSILRALLVPRAESLFFAVLLLTLSIMSIGELVVFVQFHTATVLVVVAAVFAARARREARTLRAAYPA
jgi:exopolysaccharide production protein ExoQ